MADALFASQREDVEIMNRFLSLISLSLFIAGTIAPVALADGMPVAPPRRRVVAPAPKIHQGHVVQRAPKCDPPCQPGALWEPAPPVFYNPGPPVEGSVGIFGDPYIGLFTPDHVLHSTVPAELKNIQISNADRVRLDQLPLLVDPDGLTVQARTLDVSPNRWGVGRLEISAGRDAIVIDNTGTVTINGLAVGAVNGNGTSLNSIKAQRLSSGATIGTRHLYDAYDKKASEKFVVAHAGYYITATLRQPQGAVSYLDINIAEQPGSTRAAQNASSPFTINVNGQALGLAQLLVIEPGHPLLRRTTVSRNNI